MLRKARKFGILSIHHTIREKGDLSHNVYVFHRLDGMNEPQLTERENAQNTDDTPVAKAHSSKEAILNKTSK